MSMGSKYWLIFFNVSPFNSHHHNFEEKNNWSQAYVKSHKHLESMECPLSSSIQRYKKHTCGKIFAYHKGGLKFTY